MNNDEDNDNNIISICEKEILKEIERENKKKIAELRAMLGKQAKGSQAFLKFKTDKERMAHLKKLIKEQKGKLLADRAATRAKLAAANKDLREKRAKLVKANALAKKQKAKLKSASNSLKKKEAQMKARAAANARKLEKAKAEAAKKMIEQKNVDTVIELIGGEKDIAKKIEMDISKR